MIYQTSKTIFTRNLRSTNIWWITTLSQWNQFYWFCTISRLENINITSYFIIIQKLWINKYKHGLYQLSVKLSLLKKELMCMVVMNCRRRSEKAKRPRKPLVLNCSRHWLAEIGITPLVPHRDWFLLSEWPKYTTPRRVYINDLWVVRFQLGFC